MGFQKRIWMSFVALLVTVVLIGGTVFVAFVMRRYEQDEFGTLEALAQQSAARLDQQIELMQAALDSILSDMQVLDNLKYLVNNRTRDLLHTQALWEVTVALNQWFFAKNFNRVLFYNIYGDLAASYNHRQEKINTAVTLTDLPWLESVRNRKGVARLIAPREDEWTAPEGTKVYSLVKEIQGQDIGFLEVQMRADTLDEMFSNIGKNHSILVLYEGEPFYSTCAAEKIAAYLQLIAQEGSQELLRLRTGSRDREILVATSRSDTGIRVLLVSNASAVWQKAQYLVLMAIACLLALTALFFLYVGIVSRRLARPVVQLRKQIEQLDFKGNDSLRLTDETDELGAFSKAFTQMVDTINNLVLEECEAEIQLQRARARQREMQLLYLRSQINPHFLYNTLGTIQMKAAMHDDDGVVDMIHQLILFFRNGMEYSAQIVSLHNEIEMVRAYLNIMRYRFPNVQAVFELDETLLDVDVPNFILQPLVENSFKHGLKEKCYRGEIRVVLCDAGENRARITIINDGIPVDEEQLQRIEDILKNGVPEEGAGRRHIGLNNIQSRLKLYYPDEDCGLFFRAAPGGGLAVEVVIAKHCASGAQEGENLHAL